MPIKAGSIKKKSGKATSGSSKKKAAKKTTATTSRPKKAAKVAPKQKLTKRQAQKKRAEDRAESGKVANVQGWVNKISKDAKFKGVAQISMASDLSTPYYLRRPTGALGLDLSMGGGFHAGGNAEIHGAQSVGKTHLAFRTSGMVQKNYGDRAAILIVATEIRPDKSFARKAGFRIAYSAEEITHFEGIRSKRGWPAFTPEQILDLTKKIGEVVIVTASTGEKALDAAYDALVFGQFQLVIIESLGALMSSDQEAGDVGDRTYGGSSVMLTTFMNKVYPLFIMDRITETGEGKNKKIERSMLETSVIGINQARAVMNAMGNQKKTKAAAGAFAWKHAQLVSVELTKSKPIRGKESGPKIGLEVNWEITKGKAGTHDGKKGFYDYYHVPKDDPVFWSDVELYGSQWGIDTVTDMVSAAKGLGVVEGTNWLSWEQDGKLILKENGIEKFSEALADDEELQALLRDRCYEVAELPVTFT